MGEDNITFQYVEPTEVQKNLMQKFRDLFEILNENIKINVKPSRGRKLCSRKLEEAAFWLNKSITEND